MSPFLSRPPQCEPSLHGASTRSARPCRAPSPRTPRRTPHDGRSALPPIALAAAGDAHIHRAARDFTEQALRLVLEVIDRRRSPTQLKKVLDPTMIDMVRARSVGAFPGKNLGTATLERVHVRLVDATAAEVFGTYNRGPRVFAVAARITDRPGKGWSVTSLRFG